MWEQLTRIAERVSLPVGFGLAIVVLCAGFLVLFADRTITVGPWVFRADAKPEMSASDGVPARPADRVGERAGRNATGGLTLRSVAVARGNARDARLSDAAFTAIVELCSSQSPCPVRANADSLGLDTQFQALTVRYLCSDALEHEEGARYGDMLRLACVSSSQ